MAITTAASPLVAEWTTTMVSVRHGSPRAVPQATPEIDDLLAVLVDAARAAELAAARDVRDERLAHRLEPRAHGTFDQELLGVTICRAVTYARAFSPGQRGAGRAKWHITC